MSDATSMLFGLEDEFKVLRVERDGATAVQVVIEQTAGEAPCPGCGVLTTRVKDRPVVRLKDLPASGQAVHLWWRKRRLMCGEPACPRRTFTQPAVAVRRWGRVTERLRDRVAAAIAVGNRSVSEVAREYGVSWPTAHQALVAAAARRRPTPASTWLLGIDETRFRSVRWLLEGSRWRRSNPWLTSFVDCSPEGPGTLLGLTAGRSGGCVREWLLAQPDTFRDTVRVVVIDPSAPYASGIRAVLPHAEIALDGWHVLHLAHQALVDIRRRVIRAQTGRRGRKTNPLWAYHRLLLTGVENLTTKQRDRLEQLLDAETTGQVRAAWHVKELLRVLLNQHGPDEIAAARTALHHTIADVQIPELTRLSHTLTDWWPALEVALRYQVSNARTEGFNRIIKQTKRVGCGYRSLNNYQRRILTHIAVTRPQDTAA